MFAWANSCVCTLIDSQNIKNITSEQSNKLFFLLKVHFFQSISFPRKNEVFILPRKIVTNFTKQVQQRDNKKYNNL